MAISIVNNGGTNNVVINGSNNIVMKNEGQQNISVNGNGNIINGSNNIKEGMEGYVIISSIFICILFITFFVFSYHLFKQSKDSEGLGFLDSSDISHEIENENLFEKRKKELFFLIKEKFHSEQVINRISTNILNLEEKYNKNLDILKSVEYKVDYLEQIKKENEEIILLLERFINNINIQKSNFEEIEDLEKILSIFKN